MLVLGRIIVHLDWQIMGDWSNLNSGFFFTPTKTWHIDPVIAYRSRTFAPLSLVVFYMLTSKLTIYFVQNEWHSILGTS